MEQLEKSKEKFIQTKKDRIARNEQYKAERKIKTIESKAKYRAEYKV
tara:strand:- start:625 stop:765 length:141 start_codon:yes stop_codon:yes gene_type:complete